MAQDAKFFIGRTTDGYADGPISQSTEDVPSAPPIAVNANGSAVHRFGKRIIRERQNGTSTFRSRLLLKHGSYNITGKNIPQRRVRLVSDLWNTLIDLKWRFILIL